MEMVISFEEEDEAAVVMQYLGRVQNSNAESVSYSYRSCQYCAYAARSLCERLLRLTDNIKLAGRVLQCAVKSKKMQVGKVLYFYSNFVFHGLVKSKIFPLNARHKNRWTVHF